MRRPANAVAALPAEPERPGAPPPTNALVDLAERYARLHGAHY
ncbi:hypothetical protein ACWGCW_14420 [Streptomyces sp. NPDC054933]